tara:strand:- start:34 stop:630 length:597 start_codon:yes stop_codon:yes gene_type:complete
MKYYIFGMPQTGTEYIKKLININFFAENNNKNDSGHWSWIHNDDAENATASLFQNSPLVFTYKRLPEWINSLITNGQQFIHQCGLNQYPDYHDAALLIYSQETRWSLPKAVEAWTQFHINWIRYIHRSNYLIVNKSKTKDQPYLIDRLSKIQFRLELKKKMSNWTLIEEEKILNSLTNTQLDYVNNKILKEIKDFYER